MEKLSNQQALTLGAVIVILVSFTVAGSQLITLMKPSNQAAVSLSGPEDQTPTLFQGGAQVETATEHETSKSNIEVSVGKRWLISYSNDKKDHSTEIKNALAVYPKAKIIYMLRTVMNGAVVGGLTLNEVKALTSTLGANVKYTPDEVIPKKYGNIPGSGKATLGDVLNSIENLGAKAGSGTSN